MSQAGPECQKALFAGGRESLVGELFEQGARELLCFSVCLGLIGPRSLMADAQVDQGILEN